MGNINDKVKELNPHVLSIRFTNGLTVVDCAFKDGWSIPKSEIVGTETTTEKPNYYMLYPLNEKVGIDEMLEFVSYIIKVNIEREMKIKLLQIKINELKDIFIQASLEKCKTLGFVFESDLNSRIDEDIDLSDMPIYSEIKDGEFNEGEEPIITEDVAGHAKTDNNINPSTAKFNNETFDLPPKTEDGKIVVEDFDVPEVICKCDPLNPNQVCPVCVDTKY